jgi:hypothetical protein
MNLIRVILALAFALGSQVGFATEYESYTSYNGYESYGSWSLYCEENPDADSCRGTEPYCLANSWADSCRGTLAYCRANTVADSCRGTEAYCEANPVADSCSGTPAYCRANPHSSSCRDADDPCEIDPSSQACLNYRCQNNETDLVCRDIFCTYHPENSVCANNGEYACTLCENSRRYCGMYDFSGGRWISGEWELCAP